MQYIYRLIDPRNDRTRYIGKTNNVKKRKIAHENGHSFHGTACCHWKRKLIGKGLKPIFDIIEVVLESNIDERKKFWIMQYRLQEKKYLLNETEGGEGLQNPSKATRLKIGKKSKGRVHSKEVYLKIGMSNRNKGKKVLAYADDLTFIGEYSNARRASEDLKVPYKDISKICIGKEKAYWLRTNKGYKATFLFKKDYIDDNELFLEERIKTVLKNRLEHRIKNNVTFYQYSKKLVLIKEWKNIIEAATHIKCNYRNIHFCLNKKRPTAGGFIWSYAKL